MSPVLAKLWLEEQPPPRACLSAMIGLPTGIEVTCGDLVCWRQERGGAAEWDLARDGRDSPRRPGCCSRPSQQYSPGPPPSWSHEAPPTSSAPIEALGPLCRVLGGGGGGGARRSARGYLCRGATAEKGGGGQYIVRSTAAGKDSPAASLVGWPRAPPRTFMPSVGVRRYFAPQRMHSSRLGTCDCQYKHTICLLQPLVG